MNKIFILLIFLISTNLYADYSDERKNLDNMSKKMSILKDKDPKQNHPNQQDYPTLSHQYSQICQTQFSQCYLPANQVFLNQPCWCQNPYTGLIIYGVSR